MRTAVLALLLTATTAQADFSATFRDGAPKDTLTFQNDGCPISAATIVIDLRGSAAGLIFDTTAGGAGVEVFQPIEAATTDVRISPVADGGQVLHLYLPDFATGATISLTADLDDTTSSRQITVNGAEMEGATFTIAYGTKSATGAFDANGQASVALPPTAQGCLST